MEEEIKNTPVEDFDDNFAQELADGLLEEVAVEETAPEGTEEKPTIDQPVVDEYAPLLDKLSKEVKFMDQEVKLGSIDEVKATVQKGLNYDRIQEKYKALEESEELTYLREKAKDLGMTTNEYIKALKDYEVEQSKRQEIEEYNAMINQGISEEIAQKVIETNRVAKELQREKAEIRKKQEEEEKKKSEESKLEQFLKDFPDVDIKSIPKEVLIDAENSSLSTAYTKYQNEQLKKEIAILKQNSENKSKATVKSTTEHGGTVIEKEDPFLKGLLSD